MGINFGVALGQAAKTGLDTFTTLQEEQRRADEFAWKKKEQDDQEAISKALAANAPGERTTGEGDMTKPELTSYNSQGQIVSDSDGMALQTRNVSTKEAMAGAYKQMLDSGVNAAKAQQAILGGYQLGAAGRTEERTQAEDDWHKKTIERLKLAKTDPVAVLKDIMPAYNNATSGYLNDGNKASLVEGADGTASLVIKDKDNNVVTTRPVTPEVAAEALHHVSLGEYEMLPGKFKEAKELQLKKEEVGYKGVSAKADVKKADAAMLAAQGSNKYHSAAAEKLIAQADSFEDKLPEGKKIILNSRKDSLKAAEKAYADNPTEVNAANVKAARFGLYKTYSNFGLEGLDPHKEANVPAPADAALKISGQKLKPKDLDKSLAVVANTYGDDYAKQIKVELDRIKEDAKKGNKSSGSPKSAIDTSNDSQDNKKYIREKNPRGGYIYTESPRGRTKSEYQAIDTGK